MIRLLSVTILLSALPFQSAAAQTDCVGAVGTSNRACLVAIADRYLAALAAHDPGQAPVAANVRFIERPEKPALSNATANRGAPAVLANRAVTNKNQHALAVGEGLWKTITEVPAGFKVYVPDPVSQEIGGIVMIQSENQPTALAFRLRVNNGRITDVDHVLVPITDAAAVVNLSKPRPELLAEVAPPNRLARETLRSMAYTYYDSQTQNAKRPPVAPNCARRENGVPASSCESELTTREVSYMDGLSLSRLRIADPQTGLVFSLTYNFLGGGGQGSLFAVANINKVEGNNVVAVEAVGVGEPPRPVRSLVAPMQLKDWTVFTR